MPAPAEAPRTRHACPACGKALVVVPGRWRHWACPDCGGRGILDGRLPRTLPGNFTERIRIALDAGGMRGVRRCPFCFLHFLRIRVDLSAGPLHLDACDHCRLFWFDAGEQEAAEGRGSPPPPREDDVRRPSSLSFAPGADLQSPVEVSDGFPSLLGGGAFSLLGLPLEEAAEGSSRCPAAWTMAACMAAATLLAAALGPAATFEEWGFSPTAPFRHGGLTLVSSFFLHAGFLHLLGNAWFLLTLGDDVEEELGSAPFLLLVVASTLAGHLLCAACASAWDGVSVGASGGISGVIVFYALAFPRRRLRMLFFAYFQPFLVTFTARSGLLAWAALQVLGALTGYSVVSGVNYWAHLGGATAGLAAWAWTRRRW